MDELSPPLNISPTTISAPGNSNPLRPTYAAAFQCIGDQCEDTCCHDWNIPVDKKLYDIYELLPDHDLKSLVSRYVSKAPNPVHDKLYAKIDLMPSGFCPFLSSQRLCQIHQELGPKGLTSTCSIYPRALNLVGMNLEGSLSLSCPEAARKVLLSPDFILTEANIHSGNFRTDEYSVLPDNTVGLVGRSGGLFYNIRTVLIELVKDRARPIWQRLMLIGSMCEQLEQVGLSALDSQLDQLLNRYWNLARTGECVPESWSDARRRPDVQLNIIFTLIEKHVGEGADIPRFRGTIKTFLKGLECTPTTSSSDMIASYARAYDEIYYPFFEEHPHILEHYLINYIYKNLFPFGRMGDPNVTQQGLFDEYVLLIAQFVWLRGLLIGVAAYYRDSFSTDHVIATAQSFSRGVDHYPYFLRWINQLMKTQELASFEGTSALIQL